ncbi:glycosyltransferase family 4 protein, partial [Priestia megaterium]|uniref:glycosyltransferase family 4 protein n=2 Tax=Bacillaceae TaxID=186817 RepID=UPI002FFDD3EF
TILGGIASYFPMYIQKLISSKSLQKSILKFESRLLNKYEKQVGWNFDKLVFTSPKEAKEFSEIINDRACLGIPMAYDTDKTKIRSKYQENQIVFVGKMDIPHNVAAVLYFCEKIWPIVKRANSSLEFHIIGKNPIKSVLELENKYEGVKVVGPVADIEESIKNSAVFVAPLVFGTGIKTKVIEALSYGVPVVTTSIGAEGIDFKNGHHMYVSDIEGEFANHIISLTKSEKLNESFSINGKELVHHEFSKQSMNNKWLTLLGKS